MRKFVALSALVIVLVALILAAAPRLFLPKRWFDIQLGQERAVVHVILGTPDADYFNAKNFDGWFNPFGYGASYLTVFYDSHAKVTRVKIGTDWGTEYKDWAQSYKSVLTDHAHGSRPGP